MRISRRMLPALAAALFSFLLLASSALAGTPASVTVRVEGLTETKVPLTQVTTTTEPVVKDGKPADSCPGTSAAGALQLATAGNWSGTWYGGEVKGGVFEGLGYSVETIAGESYPFTGATFWDLWINNKAEEEHGICGAEMQPGDQVLFFPCQYEEGKECPNPLEIEAPATADLGEPVNAIVRHYNKKGEPTPAAGAHIEWRGGSAMTDAQGDATLAFYSIGAYVLHVTGAEAGLGTVRTGASICVHNGNDGTCGTQLPLATCADSLSLGGGLAHEACAPPPLRLPPYPVPTDVPRVNGIANGHVFRRHHGPRVLQGEVEVLNGGTLHEVRISLQRRYRGRCFDFSGSRESFVRTKKCGSATFFSVGGSESFSYLLPARLPKGSYVYDIEGVDGTGQTTKLVSGTSHVVFQVK